VRVDADEDHLRRADRNRERQLAEMKPQRRRRVEIAVDVVNEMEAPEKRDAMIRPMPPPQRVVEQDDGDERFDPVRPLHELQQTDALAHDPRPNRL
jgi:hypothetical protein